MGLRPMGGVHLTHPLVLETMARRFWRFILICADLTNSFLDKNGPHLAAAITYYALFSLIPLTLAIMFILGTFFSGSEGLETRFALAVNTLLPVSDDTVAETLQALARTRTVTGVLGILGLLWVATTVFGAIRKGVNTLWGIRQSRRFFHERLIDISFTAGAGLLMVVPIALTAGLAVLGEFGSTLRTGSAGSDRLENYLSYALSPFISLTVFLFIYRYLPNIKVTFREVWPGALMTTMAFEGWKGVFLWYNHTFPIYDTVYGPVGALVALLTWIYISANILLVGALVTSRYSAYLSTKVEEKAQQLLIGLRKLWAGRTSSTKSLGTGDDD